MSIEPDTKDWTWVLERPCPECGFDGAGVPRDELAARIQRTAASWEGVLRRGTVAERPSPDVWSPLEYACHVRDVLRLYDVRLRAMLTQDDPLYENWDQDATAVADGYGAQDAGEVSAAVASAAGTVVAAFARLREDQWLRSGRRSDGAAFTVESFARYFLHDLVHHEHDVHGPAR